MSDEKFQCPKCRAEMNRQRYGTNIDYYQCLDCKGLLLGETELEALREEWLAEEVVDTGDAGKGRVHDKIESVDCPRCAQRMEHFTDPIQNHIALNCCSRCELVYLDAGELIDLKEKTLSDYVFGLVARLRGSRKA